MATTKWNPQDHIAATRDELTRTDSKSSTLVGLAGIAAVYASAASPAGAPVFTRILAFLAALAFTASLLTVLLGVVRPKLGNAGWLRYVNVPVDHLQHLARHGVQLAANDGGSPASAHEIEAEDLSSVTKLTRRKFAWMQLSVDLMAAGIVLLIVSRFPALLAFAA